MTKCKHNSAQDRVLVGDPVNVITGANLDANRDLQLIGPVPLEWIRHYDSSRNKTLFALGWGHTHEYDRHLAFDVDGLSYVTPLGQSIGFPPLTENGQSAVNAGVVMERISDRDFRVRQAGRPDFEFQFSESSQALLVAASRNGKSIHFVRSRKGVLETIVDSLGRDIRIEYDERGRMQCLNLFAGFGRQPRKLLDFRYDDHGNLRSIRDSYGNSQLFRYDVANRMVQKTNRRGYSFNYEYDSAGRCVRSGGEDGQFDVSLKYFPDERNTVVTRADGGVWKYFYSENNTLVQIIDPLGGTTRFEYDDQGRLFKELDPYQNATRFLYDDAGGPVGTVSPRGRFVDAHDDSEGEDPYQQRIAEFPLKFEYGDLVLRQNIALPSADDSVLRKLPNFARALIRVSPAERRELPLRDVNTEPVLRDGKQATDDGRTFDDLGNLMLRRGLKGEPRRWIYDAEGNVHRFHDHDGSDFTFDYSSWNLCTRTSDPLGVSVSYKYTSTRQLASVIDGEGNRTEYDYDFKDALVRVRRNGAVRESYVRDLAGSLLEKRDFEGRTLLTFEIGAGNLKSVRRLASGENHYFAYDRVGRTMLAATDDFEVRFAYDGLNHQIVDKRDGLGIEHRYSDDHLVETNVFDAFQTTYRRMPDGVLVIRDPSGAEHRLAVLDGGLVVRTMFNGSTEVTQHDSFGRCLVKSLRSGESGARNWYRVYEYSGEGDLVSATDSRTGTIAFEYDKAHRLVSAIAASGQPQRFDYDRADNLLRQPGLVGAGVAQGNRLVAANGDRFSFNGRDHVSERRGPNGVTRFAYNSHDMLVQVQSDTLQWEARYDPLARRISKSWNGRRVEYYWDGDKLSAEVRHDGSLRIYIYADQLSLVPLLFVEYASIDADPASGRRYYVFTNQIGAPLLVEDDRGQKVWAANIEPYGRTAIDRESTIDFPLRFPGHYWDAEIGLQYNRYRYYSPELGRYIQADPIGLGGGLNVYAYPTGPLTSVDVLGLAQCPKPPKPIDEMTDAELQKWLATLTPAQLRALKDSNPRDFNKDSDGSRIRYADYKNNGGTKSFADWSQGNKGGRGGGPGHQAVQDKLEKKGAQTEVPFGNRAADAYEPPKDGKPGVIHQIGGLNKRGDPISRERDAINDIMNSPEYKNQDPKPTIVFHDKNPPHKKVTNPQDKPNWNGGDSDDDE